MCYRFFGFSFQISTYYPWKSSFGNCSTGPSVAFGGGIISSSESHTSIPRLLWRIKTSLISFLVFFFPPKHTERGKKNHKDSSVEKYSFFFFYVKLNLQTFKIFIAYFNLVTLVEEGLYRKPKLHAFGTSSKIWDKKRT